MYHYGLAALTALLAGVFHAFGMPDQVFSDHLFFGMFVGGATLIVYLAVALVDQDVRVRSPRHPWWAFYLGLGLMLPAAWNFLVSDPSFAGFWALVLERYGYIPMNIQFDRPPDWIISLLVAGGVALAVQFFYWAPKRRFKKSEATFAQINREQATRLESRDRDIRDLRNQASGLRDLLVRTENDRQLLEDIIRKQFLDGVSQWDLIRDGITILGTRNTAIHLLSDGTAQEYGNTEGWRWGWKYIREAPPQLILDMLVRFARTSQNAEAVLAKYLPQPEPEPVHLDEDQPDDVGRTEGEAHLASSLKSELARRQAEEAAEVPVGDPGDSASDEPHLGKGHGEHETDDDEPVIPPDETTGVGLPVVPEQVPGNIGQTHIGGPAVASYFAHPSEDLDAAGPNLDDVRASSRPVGFRFEPRGGGIWTPQEPDDYVDGTSRENPDHRPLDEDDETANDRDVRSEGEQWGEDLERNSTK